MKRIVTKDIVEIAAVLGVIFSLVFVGYELRQNSTVARLDAHQIYVSNIVELNGSLAHDPDLSELILRVNQQQSNKDFTPGQQVQLMSYYVAYLNANYGLFVAIKEDVLPEKYFSIFEQRVLFNNDFFRENWPLLKREFDQDFTLYMETLPWNTQSP